MLEDLLLLLPAFPLCGSCIQFEQLHIETSIHLQLATHCSKYLCILIEYPGNKAPDEKVLTKVRIFVAIQE